MYAQRGSFALQGLWGGADEKKMLKPQEQFELSRERARLLEEELRALNGEHGDRGRGQRRSRYPGDAALIERGVNMVLDGEVGSANEAAIILSATNPGHSRDATRDRLGRAIRGRLNHSGETPKSPTIPNASGQ